MTIKVKKPIHNITVPGQMAALITPALIHRVQDGAPESRPGAPFGQGWVRWADAAMAGEEVRIRH